MTSLTVTARVGWRASLLATVAAALIVAGCGSSSNGHADGGAPAAHPKAATLQLWLGGFLTTATPGTNYRRWVDAQITEFKAAHPGSDVQITLLPADNNQLAAKVESAFSAKKVPDVMMLYSGAYTTAYQRALRSLTSYVKATPGLYQSLSNWDLSCENFACKSGNGRIIGVPADQGGFYLFYNKALFKQAGVSAPPQTFSQLIADCGKLRAKQIVPLAYGDRDGYTTVNFLDENLTSYLGANDVIGLATGKVKFTDPRVVAALQAITTLRKAGCVQDDATTHEQLDATKLFSSGKTAMVEMYPALIPDFQAGLGQTLGIARIPTSGTGPLRDRPAASSLDNWVIPQDAAHPDLAWAFIKQASGTAAGRTLVSQLHVIPVNAVAARTIHDPVLKQAAQLVANPSMPLLDSVVPNSVTLFLYKQLQLAFAGQAMPQAALAATDSAAAQQGP